MRPRWRRPPRWRRHAIGTFVDTARTCQLNISRSRREAYRTSWAKEAPWWSKAGDRIPSRVRPRSCDGGGKAITQPLKARAAESRLPIRLPARSGKDERACGQPTHQRERHGDHLLVTYGKFRMLDRRSDLEQGSRAVLPRQSHRHVTSTRRPSRTNNANSPNVTRSNRVVIRGQ